MGWGVSLLAQLLWIVFSHDAYGIVSHSSGTSQQMPWGPPPRDVPTDYSLYQQPPPLDLAKQPEPPALSSFVDTLMGAPRKSRPPRMSQRSIQGPSLIQPPPVDMPAAPGNWPPMENHNLQQPPLAGPFPEQLTMSDPVPDTPMNPPVRQPPVYRQVSEIRKLGGSDRAVAVSYMQGQQVCDRLVAPSAQGPPAVCFGEISALNDLRRAGALYPLRCLNDKLDGPGGIFARACMLCNVPQLDGVAWAAMDRGGKPCSARYDALRLLREAISKYDINVVYLLHRITSFIENGMRQFYSVDDALNSNSGMQLLQGFEVYADADKDGQITFEEGKALLQAVFVVADVVHEVAIAGNKSPMQLEAWTSFQMADWLQFAPGFSQSWSYPRMRWSAWTPSSYFQTPQFYPQPAQEMSKLSAYTEPQQDYVQSPQDSSVYPQYWQGYPLPQPPQNPRMLSGRFPSQQGRFPMRQASLPQTDEPSVQMPPVVTPAPGGQDNAILSLP